MTFSKEKAAGWMFDVEFKPSLCWIGWPSVRDHLDFAIVSSKTHLYFNVLFGLLSMQFQFQY